MPSEWNLRYDEWIIGDGEPHRSVGEIFDWFAIAFWSREGIAIAGEDAKSAVATPDFEYDVSAKVIYLSEKASIIDCGIIAIGPRTALTPKCAVGDTVVGRIGLAIPLCTELVPTQFLKAYRWNVNRISADLTPLMPGACAHDYSRAQYQEVNSTESIRTHSYILHCFEVV